MHKLHTIRAHSLTIYLTVSLSPSFFVCPLQCPSPYSPIMDGDSAFVLVQPKRVSSSEHRCRPSWAKAGLHVLSALSRMKRGSETEQTVDGSRMEASAAEQFAATNAGDVEMVEAPAGQVDSDGSHIHHQQARAGRTSNGHRSNRPSVRLRRSSIIADRPSAPLV